MQAAVAALVQVEAHLSAGTVAVVMAALRLLVLQEQLILAVVVAGLADQVLQELQAVLA